MDHKIEIFSGNTPSYKALYRLTSNKLEECKTQVEEILEKCFIQPNVYHMEHSFYLLRIIMEVCGYASTIEYLINKR